jgi:hypothetical protein
MMSGASSASLRIRLTQLFEMFSASRSRCRRAYLEPDALAALLGPYTGQ